MQSQVRSGPVYVGILSAALPYITCVAAGRISTAVLWASAIVAKAGAPMFSTEPDKFVTFQTASMHCAGRHTYRAGVGGR